MSMPVESPTKKRLKCVLEDPLPNSEEELEGIESTLQGRLAAIAEEKETIRAEKRRKLQFDANCEDLKDYWSGLDLITDTRTVQG